ncbi:MAG: sulfurtransferase [Myxococcota bacterium]
MMERCSTTLGLCFLMGALVWTACAGCNEEVAITPRREAPADTTTASLFVTPTQANAMRQEGAAVLDARDTSSYDAGHVMGAAHAPWERFVDGPLSGLLSDDLGRVQDALRAAGVHDGKPVVVYGGWNAAWGEEGRIVWMLEYLGHTEVKIVEGGYAAWQQASLPTATETPSPSPGDFTARPREERRATMTEVLDATEDGSIVILDTREPSEYAGATPYGAVRGGHIPNAQPFWWKEVFDAQGRLRSRAELRAVFDGMGIDDDTVVIAYCTGGVRSGFFYAVMRWLGYRNPQNYDGSWWEWASQADLPIQGATEATSQPSE